MMILCDLILYEGAKVTEGSDSLSEVKSRKIRIFGKKNKTTYLGVWS